MVDEVITPSVAPVVVNTAPAADSAGVTSTQPASQVSLETPVTPAAPPAETSIVEAPASKPATVLGKSPELTPPAVAEVKPIVAETPLESATPKDEGSQSVEPAQLPTYEPFTLPEGITFDEAKLVDFTKTLGEFQNTTKADQATVQKFGQQLVERHLAEVQNAVQRLTENYSAQWEKQTNAWFESFKNDPEIGKNKFETTQKLVLDAVGQYAGNEKQLNEFKSFMNETGVGNNPSIIRLINNMSSEIESLKTKYESEDGVKPLAATKPVSQKKGFYETMYGKMN